MTIANQFDVTPAQSPISPLSRLITAILKIGPIFNVARGRAKKMMRQRAEHIGKHWGTEVETLRHNHPWEEALGAIADPELVYPDYYLQPFHAYDQGNLSWEAAWEFEIAALTVHSRIWGTPTADGDGRLRGNYHQVLGEVMATKPQRILDLGCAAGLSTFSLQDCFPQAEMTAIDLSPYFLAVAQYRSQQQQRTIAWHHRAAENTGFEDQSFDLVSASLMFHELPTTAAIAVMKEAKRLLRPGGYFAIMDMDPYSEKRQKMPAYVLTLMKSTEPWIDQYFNLDLAEAFEAVGFLPPTVQAHTPLHRVIVGQVPRNGAMEGE